MFYHMRHLIHWRWKDQRDDFAHVYRRRMRWTTPVRLDDLERRLLLAVDVQAIMPMEGVTFQERVALFDTEGLEGTLDDFAATVVWGDGTSTTGVIRPLDTDQFEVIGAHTYLVQGSYPMIVTISGQAESTVTGRGTATVTDAPLIVNGRTITATPAQRFEGVVASFLDAYPGLEAGDYTAVIAWGDGQTTAGTLALGASGQLEVRGTHTYAVAGSYAVNVTVTRLLDGQTAQTTSNAVVETIRPPLTGQLDPLLKRGPTESEGGITNTNQPAFVGTGVPAGVVRLFAQRSDETESRPLGQAIIGPDGHWRITTGPLLDGDYTITAALTPPGGFPQLPVLLHPGSQLIIDTVPPRIVGLSRGPQAGQWTVFYRDDRSGMDPASLVDPANYTLFGPRLLREFPSDVNPLPLLSVLPTDPEAVVITLPTPARRGPVPNTLRIISGGITDRAGNALDGQNRGTFPSGDGQPGGNFVTRLPFFPRRPIRHRPTF